MYQLGHHQSLLRRHRVARERAPACILREPPACVPPACPLPPRAPGRPPLLTRLLLLYDPTGKLLKLSVHCGLPVGTLYVDRVDAFERHRLARHLGEALVIHPVHFAVPRPQALVVGPRVVAPSPPRQVEQVDVIVRGHSDPQPHEEASAREWGIGRNRGRMKKLSRTGLC